MTHGLNLNIYIHYLSRVIILVGRYSNGMLLYMYHKEYFYLLSLYLQHKFQKFWLLGVDKRCFVHYHLLIAVL